MNKKELIERLQKLVSKYKDEAEWGSMFASSTYSIVADDLESLIKEIKVAYKEEEAENPNSLELVRKIAEKTIGYNINGLKAMTEQESYEWYKKHSRIDPKTGDLIISDDEIGDGSYEKHYHV